MKADTVSLRNILIPVATFALIGAAVMPLDLTTSESISMNAASGSAAGAGGAAGYDGGGTSGGSGGNAGGNGGGDSQAGGNGANGNNGSGNGSANGGGAGSGNSSADGGNSGGFGGSDYGGGTGNYSGESTGNSSNAGGGSSPSGGSDYAGGPDGGGTVGGGGAHARDAENSGYGSGISSDVAAAIGSLGSFSNMNVSGFDVNAVTGAPSVPSGFDFSGANVSGFNPNNIGNVTTAVNEVSVYNDPMGYSYSPGSALGGAPPGTATVPNAWESVVGVWNSIGYYAGRLNQTLPGIQDLPSIQDLASWVAHTQAMNRAFPGLGLQYDEFANAPIGFSLHALGSMQPTAPVSILDNLAVYATVGLGARAVTNVSHLDGVFVSPTSTVPAEIMAQLNRNTPVHRAGGFAPDGTLTPATQVHLEEATQGRYVAIGGNQFTVSSYGSPRTATLGDLLDQGAVFECHSCMSSNPYEGGIMAVMSHDRPLTGFETSQGMHWGFDGNTDWSAGPPAGSGWETAP